MKKPFLFLVLPALILAVASCGRRDAPADDISPSASPAADLPADWPGPADLPPCPGWTAVITSDGSPDSGSGDLRSNRSTAGLRDFYADHLGAGGWTLVHSMEDGDDTHMQFRLGSRMLRLQVGPDPEQDGATRVRLAWRGAAAGPAPVESRAPDVAEEQSEPVIPSVEW